MNTAKRSPPRTNHRFGCPKSLSVQVEVCIPTPDALCHKSSQLLPMTHSGIMSVYGGLVPLGFSIPIKRSTIYDFVYTNTV